MNNDDPRSPRDAHPLALAAEDTRSSRDHRVTRPSIANGRRAIDTPPDDELDALADLFLGPAETRESQSPPSRPKPQAPRRVEIEGVLLGHLPVSAAAWPGQYARHRAASLGAPVAIIRFGGGSISVDLVGSGGPNHPLRTETDAIEFARSRADTVILRVDEPREERLASLPAVSRLSLLTGTDDAAVVACYRKLKGLAAAATAADRPLPKVGLTLMGCDDAKGKLAHDRVERAARAFLDADLLEPICIDRIGPTGSTAVYRGPTALSLDELGELLTSATPRSIPMLATAAPQTIQPLDIEPPRTPQPEPARAESSATRAAPTPRTDALAALIAGLAPIESRCPVADRVELASDELGGLHLITAVLSAHPEVSSTTPTDDLLCAAAWAQTNAALLAKAEPQLAGDAVQPTLHLVTDQPGQATPRLGTPIRVHLAIPATPTAFGLVATPLDE